jgi:hypothetical protein
LSDQALFVQLHAESLVPAVLVAGLKQFREATVAGGGRAVQNYVVQDHVRAGLGLLAGLLAPGQDDAGAMTALARRTLPAVIGCLMPFKALLLEVR